MNFSIFKIFGSLRTSIDSKVAVHQKTNSTIRAAAHSLPIKILRVIYYRHSFGWFLLRYILLAIFVICAEKIMVSYWPCQIPDWEGPIKGTIKDITGFYIGGQAGVLGIISIAVGLVTLIAQNEDGASIADVRIYYDESLARESMASGIALLGVLCIQALWPAQFALHKFGYGTGLPIFKMSLTSIHSIWFFLNLAATAHFTAVSLEFVYPSFRKRVRERYTASQLIPEDLKRRLLQLNYMDLSNYVLGNEKDKSKRIYLSFGFSSGQGRAELKSKGNLMLYDVWIYPLRLAIHSWMKRCEEKLGNEIRANSAFPRISLNFLCTINQKLSSGEVWCRRSGGVPLSWLERWLIRFSFRFHRSGQ